MTRLNDGNSIIQVEMCVWNGHNYSEDWSNEFFEVGQLSWDEETDSYIVDDVELCVDAAIDAINHTGDFSCWDGDPIPGNTLFVNGFMVVQIPLKKE